MYKHILKSAEEKIKFSDVTAFKFYDKVYYLDDGYKCWVELDAETFSKPRIVETAKEMFRLVDFTDRSKIDWVLETA